jgi:hypothetical protein
VTAESFYEVVGKPLVIMRQHAWVEEIGEGLTDVRARVTKPSVEHTVLVKDFRRWLERQGRTTAEFALEMRLVEIVQKGLSRP